jgi:hypothetical protein
LDASTGFSQISGVPGLGGFANLFFFLGRIRKIGCYFFLYFVAIDQNCLGPESIRVSGEDATAGNKYFGILHRLDLSRFQFAWKAEISDDAFCLA